MKDIMDFLDTMAAEKPSSGNKGCSLSDLPIAYSYTPMQEIDTLYSYADGLKNGTMFPELNLPLGVYGNNFCAKKEVL